MKKNDLFLSIIIPVYNSEKYLQRCLDSIFSGENGNDFNVILINDGSTDKSQDIIDEYKEKYPTRVLAYIQSNQGIGPTRNFGLSKSKSKYVWFVDNDDCICTNCIPILKKILENSEIDILDIDYLHKYYTTSPLSKITEDLELRKISQKEAFFFKKDYPWTKIYRRSFLCQFENLFPNIYGEDTATVYKLYAETELIYELNAKLYAWFNRPDSFSNKIHSEKHYKTYPILIKTLLDQSNKYNKLKDEFQYIAFSKNNLAYPVLYMTEINNDLLSKVKEESKREVDNIISNINNDNLYIKIDKFYKNEMKKVELRYKNSTSWKITKPLRKILITIKKVTKIAR